MYKIECFLCRVQENDEQSSSDAKLTVFSRHVLKGLTLQKGHILLILWSAELLSHDQRPVITYQIISP